MHSVIISDNRDSLLGMRLAGIDGVLVDSPEKAWEVTSKYLNDPEVGILFFTEKAADMIKDRLVSFREKSVFPLITVIPDRHGFEKPNQIVKQIKEAIGVQKQET